MPLRRAGPGRPDCADSKMAVQQESPSPPQHAGTRERAPRKKVKEPTYNMMYCFSSSDDDEPDIPTRPASVFQLERHLTGSPPMRESILQDAFPKAASSRSAGTRTRRNGLKKEPTYNMMYCFASSEEDSEIESDAPVETAHNITAPALREVALVQWDMDSPEGKIAGQIQPSNLESKVSACHPSVRPDDDDSQTVSSASFGKDAPPADMSISPSNSTTWFVTVTNCSSHVFDNTDFVVWAASPRAPERYCRMFAPLS
jgi:hypothetical protein